MNKKIYYETISMAYFIMEGHNKVETAKEFGVSVSTVTRRINKLADIRIGIYQRVIRELHKRDNFEGIVIDI